MPKNLIQALINERPSDWLARPGLQLIAAEHSWPIVDARPLQVPGATWASPEAEAADKARGCVEAAKLLDPTATEGFVVMDAAFRRVKIKSPKYVRLHALKNNGVVSPKRAIELWVSGEAAEVLAVFPELAPQITPIHERLAQIAEQAHADTGFHRQNTTSRKEFASSVAKLPHAAVCFKLYTLVEPSVADAEKIMRGMSPSALERLVMVDIEWIGYDASAKPSGAVAAVALEGQ